MQKNKQINYHFRLRLTMRFVREEDEKETKNNITHNRKKFKFKNKEIYNTLRQK